MELITYQSYMQFKSDLDHEIMNTTEGFVRIGYLLRVAQDTNVLTESGYANVNEFAQAEYGLDKSQVSRFMAINERFSQNGYAPELDLKYKGYGVAKLGIMLQLPDSINEQLSPDMSKTEITTLKNEYQEEQKITDLEVMMEEKIDNPLLQQVMDKVLYEHPSIFEQIFEENKKAEKFNIIPRTEDYVEDILAAAGEAVYTVRVEGVGKVMMLVKSASKLIRITNMRTGEQLDQNWEDLGYILNFKENPADTVEKAWEEKYNDKFPITAPEKPSKVVTSPKPESHPDKTKQTESPKMAEKPVITQSEPPKPTKTPSQQESEELQPAQTPIPTQSVNEIEVVEGEVVETIEVAPVQQPESSIITHAEEHFEDYKLKALKNALKCELEMAMEYFEKEAWASVEMKCTKAAELAQKCSFRESELEEDE